MRRHAMRAMVAVCLLALCSPVLVAGAPGVLSWLASLPFPGRTQKPAADSYAGVAIGPEMVKEGRTVDKANPPLAAPPGTVLSDSFHTTTLRRGLHAQRDFKNGTEILRVAFEQMFNYSSPMAPGVPLDPNFSELVLNAVHTGAVLDSQALLALRLLLQYQNHHEWRKAGDASKLHWDPVLGDLPKPSSVCFFTQEELAELQIPIESPVFAARSQQLDTITESYLAFDEMIKSKPEYAALFPSGFTEKWYRWAYGIVLNTAVEVPIRDEEGVQGALLVLVPAFNHLNHANPPYHNARFQWNEDPEVLAHVQAKHDPNVKVPFPQGHGSLSLVATRDIKSGEEITITYGSLSAIPLLVSNHTSSHDEAMLGRDKHHNDTSESHFTYESFFQQLGLSNSQLLVHYGIALPTNEFERVALDIGLDSDTVGVEEHHWDIMELKKQIIDLNELDHGTLIGIDGRLDQYFIQALRTKHLTAEDLAHLAGNEYEFSPEHGYLSLQNELKWQLQLVVSIENLLTAYPTTLAHDLEAIRTMLYTEGKFAHTSNLLHALAYRASLKRILHSLILRTLKNIDELFLNISTQWSETLHKHNLEEEAELRQHLDLTPEAKAKLMAEWNGEQKAWFTQMEEWKGEMDKWESTWQQWVQTVMGSRGLIDQVPHHNLHTHVTPETVDEMLDPSIHALQLEHEEEEVTVDVAEGDHAGDHAAGLDHEVHAELDHDPNHDNDYDDVEEEQEHDEL